MKHIAWDYEESEKNYYHIYSVSDKGDEIMDEAICIELQRSPEMDEAIKDIVSVLNSFASAD